MDGGLEWRKRGYYPMYGGREGLGIEQGELISHNKKQGSVCGWVGSTDIKRVVDA